METNERWKTDGDCSKCRRQNYCKTACKKQKQRTERWIASTVTQAMDERTGGAFSATLEAVERIGR